MKLARVFGDYMVLQRRMPICIWGENEIPEQVEVKLNGVTLCTEELPAGAFTLMIPAQEAMANATLEIGSLIFHHVDIGEVWVAGGQSNMEFGLQYTNIGEEVILSADDPHLRCYTVGQYSFAGERELGYKAWNPWDCWLPFTRETAPEMTAVGVHFAQEIRKQGIPVGILSCNWGGTSASAWMSRSALADDPAIRCYVTEFDERVDALDLERYNAVKRIIRPAMAAPESRRMMNIIRKNTFRPGEFEKMMAENQSQQSAQAPAGEMLELSKMSIADIMAVGPGDPNEPGALYENMLREIIGYSIRGAIWYQGETDESHPDIYDRLFAAMVSCWRRDWHDRNSAQTRLPFLFVQLAPYGTWNGGCGDKFPALRACQAKAAKEVPDCFMASISDIGNIFDIHPKVKKPVGLRLALLARKYVYGEETAADAPEGIAAERSGDTVRVTFRWGEGLYIVSGDFTQYNGFPVETIEPALLPPILGGVNGLQVLTDGKVLPDAVCTAEGTHLSITAPALAKAQRIEVKFAQTGFYQVNLYNAADLPAEPFELVIE
ncbi:MAG: sialate O-acetylesterase [Faecousia sp.]